jgi:hypothetical protein
MPFACAVGPGSKYEALGLNPSREQRAAKLASDNRTRPRDTNDFLTKHRKWLSELNKERRRKVEEDKEAVNMAVEKTKKFKEYAAKLRQNIRQAKAQHDDSNYLSNEGFADADVQVCPCVCVCVRERERERERERKGRRREREREIESGERGGGREGGRERERETSCCARVCDCGVVVHVCMYVCMCVCVCVCDCGVVVHVCMYVCMCMCV